MDHDSQIQDETGLCAEDNLVQPNEEGCAQMVPSNPSSYPQVAEDGTTTVEVVASSVVEADMSPELDDNQIWACEVWTVSDGKDAFKRKWQLQEVVPKLMG